MAEARKLVALQGDKLDLLIWREMGLAASEVGRVLRANPKLADLGPILPMGTIVTVPATNTAKQNATRTRPQIQLWD